MSNSKKDLFPIMDDINYSGNATRDQAEIILFVDQLKKLKPGDREKSVSIPKTFCGTRKSATNFFNRVKRYIQDYKVFEDYYFATKGVKASDGEYLGTRVWRLK